ncbi:MAG: hypothetical protein IPM23_24935 [Candidatus Melainabacteria bacterium]|nr:hypothetical protein [Candidatus Melainabacteria bacterium]
MSSKRSNKLLAVLLCISMAPAASGEDEICGPPNLLKTMKTPFSGQAPEPEPDTGNGLANITLSPISIGAGKGRKLSLTSKLVPPRLYLPERMVLGQPAKFTIKGPPGDKVAMAMADSDSGARDIAGHKVRLGPDRKLVAVGEIPQSGVFEFYIGTPIEGDLIGQYLYFEAAVWKKNDVDQAQFAQTVAVTGPEGPANGVLVAPHTVEKRGVNFVPDSAVPLTQRQNTQSLGSGQP